MTCQKWCIVQPQGITSFDTRTVKFYDGNKAYDIEFSIATLQNGEKVAYAKKFFGYDEVLTKKIQTDEARSNKSPLNQQSDLNNSIPQNTNKSSGDIDNTAPTSDPDIRFSLSETGKMVDDKGNEIELQASEVGTHGTLMAIRNINEGELRGMLSLGGIPVPSIAITDPSKVDHTAFGSISLNDPPKMAHRSTQKGEMTCFVKIVSNLFVRMHKCVNIVVQKLNVKLIRYQPIKML